MFCHGPDPQEKAHSITQADCIRIVPNIHRGLGDIVRLNKKDVRDVTSYTFNYQRDTYILESMSPVTFSRLPYPSSNRPALSTFQKYTGLGSAELASLQNLYGRNEFNIPIPSFLELFNEHATAPFFVFQMFCVALWCLDEYWYYSLFTLFMLIVFECTVVWQVSFPRRFVIE
jgi:cation-transporting ATPase 13A1